MYLLLAVAILVLLGAFVNYVNLTTARALDRAREVGVRKAVGSNQQQIRMLVLVSISVKTIATALLDPVKSLRSERSLFSGGISSIIFYASL